MAHLLRRLRDARPTAAAGLVLVLVASLVVAGVLAYQAIDAARQRRAVSEAMFRQYAQLAAWEFSRQARRNIDEAVMHALSAYAHPERQGMAQSCNCGTLGAVEAWFDVWPGGDIRTRGVALTAAVHAQVARMPLPADGAAEGAVRVARLPEDATRFVAIKAEPHVGITGGHVGLVADDRSLTPVLERTYERIALLPAMLTDRRDARTLVHLRVITAAGETIFSSKQTTPGPYVVQNAFPADAPLALITEASLTPTFIADLGAAHGAGPSVRLVVALVAVNAVLVAAGLWLLARERELAQLRSNFVAGVSHELRTPLAQIRMFSETLLLNRVRNESEKQRALEIIGQESTRLSQLVDNVLHVHRKPHVSESRDQRAVDIAALVRDVVESFEPLAASKRVRLALTHAPDHCLVQADAGGLRQVLLNLLDNAVKFGPAGQRVTIDVEARTDTVLLKVEDEGPGVPAPERQRIFNMFERGRRSSSSGGAGLGLAVVRQIVQAHRGEIAVGDADGRGARFTVTLPRATHGYRHA